MSTTAELAEKLDQVAGKLGALEVAVAKQTTVCKMCQPRILGNGKSYGDRLTELETTAAANVNSRTRLGTAKIRATAALGAAAISGGAAVSVVVLQWLFSS